jgi:hypothetical protein
MNTQQLVTLLKEDFAPGYARARLLAYIERAQNELFNNDCAQMQFLNTADPSFPIPILSTTDGVLDYTPSVSNLVDSAGSPIALTVGGYAVACRRITKVFVQDSMDDFAWSRRFGGAAYQPSGLSTLDKTSGAELSYSEVPGQPFDKNGTQDAHFTFIENPGTHADKYFIEFYRSPYILSSEQIPLSLDGNEWAEALITAVRGYIEQSRNGRSDLLDAPVQRGSLSGSFRGYWIPKFRNSMNKGGTTRTPLTFGTRECL